MPSRTSEKPGKNEQFIGSFAKMPILIKTFMRLRHLSCSTSKIDWKSLKFKTKVPQSVVKSQFAEKTTRIKITEDEINLLERLSLVDLDRK